MDSHYSQQIYQEMLLILQWQIFCFWIFKHSGVLNSRACCYGAGTLANMRPGHRPLKPRWAVFVSRCSSTIHTNYLNDALALLLFIFPANTKFSRLLSQDMPQKTKLPLTDFLLFKSFKKLQQQNADVVSYRRLQ